MTRSNFRKLRRLFLIGTALVGVLGTHAKAGEPLADQAARGLTQPVSAASGAKAGQNPIAQGAQNYIQAVADRGVGVIATPGMTPERRKSSFARLLDDSFDMDTIGRFALGTHWRTATPAQRAEYGRLFRRMIINVYSARFSDYKGQTLTAKSARTTNDTDTVVTSVLKMTDGSPDVQIDWRVRHKSGRYKIVDVMVEGVSMSVTQRSDFSSVIQRGGGNVEALLNHLRNSK